MHYKAIIFDLDGTAIPNKKDGMPSGLLVDLVQKLKNEVFVCAATGRSLADCKGIFKSLQLTSPCVISGGTQIIDPVTQKIFWEQSIPAENAQQVIDIVKTFNYKLSLSDEQGSFLAREKIIEKPENIIYILDVNKINIGLLLEEIRKIPGISALSVPSYKTGCFNIHVTHIEATKKQALELLLSMLKVKKEQVIGFGDGNNDLPIFEAVGYKVAMGNGSQELKDVADLIAPSAEEDGVARVIEKLVRINKITLPASF